jgi:hypothetical protein
MVILAMTVSLGDTAYNIVEGEEELSLSDLAEELYEEDKVMGRMNFKMEQVHHDTGRAIAPHCCQRREAQDPPPSYPPTTKRTLIHSTTAMKGMQATQPSSPQNSQAPLFKPMRLSRQRGKHPPGRGLPRRTHDMQRSNLHAWGAEGGMLLG